jgi:hypothetical protein
VIRALALALLLAGACGPRAWTAGDTAGQVAVTAALAADYTQTRAALDDGGIEHNPVMGAGGERLAPEVYFPATAVALTGAAVALPRPWRRVLQVAAVGVQVHTVAGNWSRGYSVQIPW